MLRCDDIVLYSCSDHKFNPKNPSSKLFILTVKPVRFPGWKVSKTKGKALRRATAHVNVLDRAPSGRRQNYKKIDDLLHLSLTVAFWLQSQLFWPQQLAQLCMLYGHFQYIQTAAYYGLLCTHYSKGHSKDWVRGHHRFMTFVVKVTCAWVLGKYCRNFVTSSCVLAFTRHNLMWTYNTV